MRYFGLSLWLAIVGLFAILLGALPAHAQSPTPVPFGSDFVICVSRRLASSGSFTMESCSNTTSVTVSASAFSGQTNNYAQINFAPPSSMSSFTVSCTWDWVRSSTSTALVSAISGGTNGSKSTESGSYSNSGSGLSGSASTGSMGWTWVSGTTPRWYQAGDSPYTMGTSWPHITIKAATGGSQTADVNITCTASVPPTDTPAPPTNTPTDTPIPPTNTPTNTPIPPTNTPTNTPIPDTPTNTPIPPTNTPTATGTDLPDNGTPWTPQRLPTQYPARVLATPQITPTPGAVEFPGVVWLCLGYPEASPVCTWGDYIEVSGRAHTLPLPTGGDKGPVNAFFPDSDPPDDVLIGFVAPPEITSLGYTCSIHMEAWQSNIPQPSYLGSAQVLYNFGQVCNGCGIVGAGGGSVANDNKLTETHSMTVTAGAGSFLQDELPATYEEVRQLPGADARALATSGFRYRFLIGGYETDSSLALFRLACRINWLRKDGNKYLPFKPVVGDSADALATAEALATRSAVATAEYNAPWSTPGSPWSTPVKWVMTPDDIEFGTTPGSTTCYTIIPAFEVGPYTVSGYDLGVDWDATEVCTSEYGLSLKWLGQDFSVWVLAMVSIGAFGILYSRFK